MRLALPSLLFAALGAASSGAPPASPTPTPATTPATTPTTTPTTAPAVTPAASSKLQNTLRWQTASEVENLGFDVYRGPEEKGPFTKITARPVPGAGTTDEPRSYAYVDEAIEAGKTYWYYVESISMSGVREKFTPTFKAPVKGVAADPAPGPSPSAKKEAPAPH